MAKELEKIMEKLRNGVIIVEGKKDQQALQKLDIKNTHMAVGRVMNVCEKMDGEKEVIILTDLDKKGHWLAEQLEERLWSMGIKVDVMTRKKLGRILQVKYFEEINRKYEKFRGEYNG